MGKRGRRNKSRQAILFKRTEQQQELDYYKNLKRERKERRRRQYYKFRNFKPLKKMDGGLKGSEKVVKPVQASKDKSDSSRKVAILGHHSSLTAGLTAAFAMGSIWNRNLDTIAEREQEKRLKAHEALYCMCSVPTIDSTFKRCLSCGKRA